MVSFTLRQVTRIVNNDQYEVANEVTSATDSSTAVYVFKTVNQAFSNYASAADMANWPASYEEAQVLGKLFYRLPRLTRVWDTLSQMNEDLDMSMRRLQFLSDELTAQRGTIEIDRTTTIAGG